MKTVCIILVFLLCRVLTHAQDWSKLPELPVWYEEVNGRGINMSYLPDFDTANGGKDAIYFGYGDMTNYNRYIGDTVNMFSFGEGHPVIRLGDFNGDGIRDYFAGLSIYQGIKKNAPPELPKKATYGGIGCTGYIGTVADINNDGKDDMIFFASSIPDNTNNIGAIIVGSERLNGMEVISLPLTEYLDFNENAQCLMDAYYLQGKGARIITMTWDKQRANGKLHLWAVDIQGDVGKRIVKYLWLSSLRVSNGDAQGTFRYFTTFHRNSEQHTLKCLLSTYNLNQDLFQEVLNGVVASGTFPITYSILNKNFPGWHTRAIINGKIVLLCLSGNPQENNVPFARIKDELDNNPDDKFYVGKIANVGDVNHDNLNDIACTYTNSDTRIFRIYLGVDGTTDVQNNADKTSILISIQNPLQKDLPHTINITSDKETPTSIQLYSLQGEKVAEVWNGVLQTGINTVQFDSHKYVLPSGMYNLRLVAGKQVVDKAIIIE